MVDPLILKVAIEKIKAQLSTSPDPLIVGISGAQGSGKTTLAKKICECFEEDGRRVVSFSLDDFYYSSSVREAHAKKRGKIFETRGPPGTHDVKRCIDAVDLMKKGLAAELPNYNKRSDQPSNPRPIPRDLELVIFEGWCLCAAPSRLIDLIDSINELERKDDPDHSWRIWVNDSLSTEYQSLFERVDYQIFLCAPDFNVVSRWRLQQEYNDESLFSLLKRLWPINRIRMRRFVSHYERLTRQMMSDQPLSADLTFFIDRNRNLVGLAEMDDNQHNDRGELKPCIAIDQSIMEIFTVYREYVKHQYELINSRTTWFVQSQTFLLAAYGAIYVVTLGPTRTPHPLQVASLESVACSISLALCVIFFTLIRAASRPIFDLFDRWEALRKQVTQVIRLPLVDPLRTDPRLPISPILPSLTGGFNRNNAKLGVQRTMLIPLTLGVGWVVLLGLSLWTGLHRPSHPGPGQAAVEPVRSRLSGLDTRAIAGASSRRQQGAYSSSQAPH